MYNIYSDIQSVEKSNSDLVSFIEKLEEGKRKLGKKLDIQSQESGNHFETLIKNHGEGEV